METLSQAATVVMDKTGTLTKGVFEVVGIHHSPVEDHILLEWAALAENASSHPISKSLQKAYGKPLDRSRVTEIKELSGRGIQATVDGRSILCGNAKLMEEAGISYLPCHQVGTLVHMAVDGTYAGHILIADVVKPHSIRAIDELKNKASLRLCSLVMRNRLRKRSLRSWGFRVSTVNFYLKIKSHSWKRLPSRKMAMKRSFRG